MHRYIEEGKKLIREAIDEKDGRPDSLQQRIITIYLKGNLHILEEEFLLECEDNYYEDNLKRPVRESLEQAVINAEEAISAEEYQQEDENPFDVMTEGNSHSPFCNFK